MGKPYEDSAQQSEDVGLYEGDQKLQTVHEEEHQDAEDVKSDTEAHTHCPSQEYHAGEAEYHGVTCHHVGEETYHQGKRLGKDAENLDDGHQWNGLQEDWHIGPQYVFPILLVAKEVDGQHRAYRQEEGDIDIACHVDTAGEEGYQSHEVTGQDEEEGAEQIWRKALVLLFSYRRLHHIIMYGHHDELHRPYKSLRRLAEGIMTTIPTSATGENHYQDNHGYPYLQHHLGNAQIQRALGGPVGHLLINLAMMGGIKEEWRGQRVLGANKPLTRGAASDDDGQWNTERTPLVTGYVPFIRISLPSVFLAISGGRFMLALIVMFVYFLLVGKTGKGDMLTFVLIFAAFYLSAVLHHTLFFTHKHNTDAEKKP